MSERRSKEGPKPKADSVLVIHEDRRARDTAISFCEDLTSQTRAERLDTHWTSFESLKTPEKFEKAVANGVQADWVVFAVSAAGDLPKEVKLWTEHWLNRRGDREGALVGLVYDGKGNPCEIACLKEVYFRHLAHRAGMDYLSQLPQVVSKSATNLLQSFDERAGQVTSVLKEILHKRFLPPNLPLT